MNVVVAYVFGLFLVVGEEPRGIEGIYYVQGAERHEGGNKPYYGACIVKAKKEGYSLQWISGGAYVNGFGFKINDVLVVSWVTPNSDPPIVGVTMYKIGKGKLTGHWYSPASGKVNSEELRYLRALETPDL